MLENTLYLSFADHDQGVEYCRNLEALLARGLRQVTSLPEDLAISMMAAINRPVDLSAEIEGEVEM